MTEPDVKWAAGFVLDDFAERVVLLNKRKPTWQNSLWNAVGGHVESGETFIAAMDREWQEESGFEPPKSWAVRAIASGTTLIKGEPKTFELVYFVSYDSALVQQVVERTALGEDWPTPEPLAAFWTHSLPAMLMLHIKWLVPLCCDRYTDTQVNFTLNAQLHDFIKAREEEYERQAKVAEHKAGPEKAPA